MTMQSVIDLCREAKEASHLLPRFSAAERRAVLIDLAGILGDRSDEIIRVNQIDVQEGAEKGLSDVLLDRLTLTRERIEGIAEGVKNIANLPDPLEEVFDEQQMSNGLRIRKQRVPLGVLAVIYESRPNVTIDVAALAIKSGNAVVLRGGKETLRTNVVLVDCIHEALKRHGIPEGAIQFIDDPSRELVEELLRMYHYVDMLIPRGGAALHTYCRENSLIPVITGGIGVCHLFVDESADQQKALEVIVNAKIQRPTVCNALDTVLLHEKTIPAFLPVFLNRMKQEKVTIHLPQDLMDAFSLSEGEMLKPTASGDYDREWLSLNLNVVVVPDLSSALSFIKQHSTAHSDGILTENKENAELFLNEIDSAVVYVNASTRFTDGAQLGLGAEVAISTQKLHARGPMGLQELTSYKWIVEGDYHIRN